LSLTAPVLRVAVLCPSVAPHLVLHSFPTRRSSDLDGRLGHHQLFPFYEGTFLFFQLGFLALQGSLLFLHLFHPGSLIRFLFFQGDRKSTRLNSSHVSISYAVVCL